MQPQDSMTVDRKYFTPPRSPLPAQSLRDETPEWAARLPDTDHVRFFRRTDWANSKLGPLKDWSLSLRLFVNMLFADSRATCIWWGPDLVAIYNEPYVPLSAQAHPKLMGATFREGYPDLWDSISPLFDQARRSGVASNFSAGPPLIVERKGWKEEAFFTGNFVPIGADGEDGPQGFYNAAFETTPQRLADRRTSMLNRMSSVPELTPDGVGRHILTSLETNPHDIPMAILYELYETSDSAELRLRGNIGVPAGHCLLVDREKTSSCRGLIPECRLAGDGIHILERDSRFDGIDWRGFENPSRRIAVMAITCGSRVLGYLIVGTNPYRPHDNAGIQFMKDLSMVTSGIVSTAMNAEEAKLRQQRLEQDLALTDMKLRHLIEHASVGMAHISLDGTMIWANEHYYALCGSTAEKHQQRKSFLDVYHEADRTKAERVWHKLLAGANHVTEELRLKRLYTSPIGDPELAQIQVLAFPYRENGQIKSVMACTTDISRLKWAESFQARLASEARKAKRQQEAFIDVVSHEMRNPLSAIVHCADEISRSLHDCRAKLSQAHVPKACSDVLVDNVASANIILQCANHQKRIIDDILTLSKLDSMLLSITPTSVKPSNLIDSMIAIFEAELRSNDIQTTISPDSSLGQVSVDFLNLDPSRITQVFINLITNAIKFTKSEARKTIEVRYGATLANPRKLFPEDIHWAPKEKPNDGNDVTAGPEWGTGEEVYLSFIVKDSGIGMGPDEVHKIFERFSQANVRTHVRYGGSGLGLFISKQLTEKQGGEIGVASQPGEGSTFGFYVKARRAESGPRSRANLSQVNGDRPTQKIHVLLVEDNIINQQVLGRQLKKAGCAVSVANHGLEALTILTKRQEFDIILMDLEMPVLGGLPATQEIRKKQREGSIKKVLPIIVVTANVRKEQVDSAMRAGADRVMHKPFKAAELLHMIKGLVNQPLPPPPSPISQTTLASSPAG